MKYTNTHIDIIEKTNGGGLVTLLVVSLFLSISTLGCNDVTQLDESEEPSTEISEIDGKPIITISAANYYNANSGYINKVMDRLSHNGRAIVEAMDTQVRQKVNSTQEVETDAVIVGLSELKSTQSYKTTSTSSSYSMDDLSSEIQVVDENGETEKFELILVPHGGGTFAARAKSGNATLSTKNTWLALDPDRFYVQEDAEGNEIWPITFPAVSIDDPNHEIEVTLDRDGTLTWPRNIQNKSNSVSSGDQMVYMDNMAIIQPCMSGPDDECTGSGGLGGGGTGGGALEVEVVMDLIRPIVLKTV